MGGEALARVGQVGEALSIILAGKASTSHGPSIDCSEFMGELNQLAGGRCWSTPTRWSRWKPRHSTRPAAGPAGRGGGARERIMRALILRRVGLLESGAGGPVIVGRAEDGDVLRLEGFLRRNGHPRQRLDPNTDAEAKALIERFHVDPVNCRSCCAERTAVAQSRRERARPLHRAGRPDRSRPAL